MNIRWDYNEHNHPSVFSLSDFIPSGWQFDDNGKLYKTQSNGMPKGDRGFYNTFISDPKYNKRMPKYFHVTAPNINKTIKYTDEAFSIIN